MVLFLQDDESKGTENIWKEHCFFGDQRAELTILKANFPQNTLVYINQATVSLVKGGDKAICLDLVVVGQIMPAANVDPKIDFDKYEYKAKKIMLYVLVYNTTTGLYGWLKKKLAYITLRGDPKERFLSYGFYKEKSSLLYCTMKKPMPNIFNCTCFKNHVSLLLDENQNQAKFSNLFLYLSSTLDSKEEFMHYKDNVNLHPVNLTFDDIKQAAAESLMDPSTLNTDARDKVTGGYYKIMKKIAEVYNQNLVRNSDAFISSGEKIDPDNEIVGLMILTKRVKKNFN